MLVSASVKNKIWKIFHLSIKINSERFVTVNITAAKYVKARYVLRRKFQCLNRFNLHNLR